jgi:hypothetical protein
MCIWVAAHHPAIRCDPSAIESGRHLLAVDTWKSEGSNLSSDMAGVVKDDLGRELARWAPTLQARALFRCLRDGRPVVTMWIRP